MCSFSIHVSVSRDSKQREPFKEQTIDYVDYYVVQSSGRSVDLDLRSWERTGFGHAASGSLTV